MSEDNELNKRLTTETPKPAAKRKPRRKIKRKSAAKPKAVIERGRTAADVPPAMQQQAGLVAGSREEAAHDPGRPTRIPMGNALKLEVPESMKEKGFYYRFFQDRGGRINQAKAAHYEIVVDEQGNSFTRQSGPHQMILMRLPQKYRDEDLALKKKAVQATMDKEAQIGDGEYAPGEDGRPDGGTTAIRRHTSDSPTG